MFVSCWHWPRSKIHQIFNYLDILWLSFLPFRPFHSSISKNITLDSFSIIFRPACYQPMVYEMHLCYPRCQLWEYSWASWASYSSAPLVSTPISTSPPLPTTPLFFRTSSSLKLIYLKRNYKVCVPTLLCLCNFMTPSLLSMMDAKCTFVVDFTSDEEVA